MNVLPDFLVVGPRRTGTTRMHDLLQSRVVLPEGVKETRFFDLHYHRGLEWYAAHFRRAGPGDRVGEVAPTYFDQPAARSRIRQHLPGCRIVCIVRDPVARVRSLYQLMRHYGLTDQPVAQAVDEIPEFRESNRYAHHLEGWIDLFGRDQVLIQVFDDLKRDPQEYFAHLCRFLEVPPLSLEEQQLEAPEQLTPARHAGLARLSDTIAHRLRSQQLYPVIELAKKFGLKKLVFGGGEPLPPLPDELATRLKEQFRPEIERLERLLDRDLSAWYR